MTRLRSKTKDSHGASIIAWTAVRVLFEKKEKQNWWGYILRKVYHEKFSQLDTDKYLLDKIGGCDRLTDWQTEFEQQNRILLIVENVQFQCSVIALNWPTVLKL